MSEFQISLRAPLLFFLNARISHVFFLFHFVQNKSISLPHCFYKLQISVKTQSELKMIFLLCFSKEKIGLQ